jgi:signal transduction histidine kinase
MDPLQNGRQHGAHPIAPERLVRAASHALGNELFSIRSYGELALMCDDIGPDARRELSALVTQVDKASSLLRELSNAARDAAVGGDGVRSLASAFQRLLPGEMAVEDALG